MQFKEKYISIIILSLVLFISCKKFVDVSPPINQLSKSLVFDNDNTALQVVNGIYSEMMNNSAQFSDGSITYYCGLCADELYYYSPSIRDEFLSNEISQDAHGTIEAIFWNPCYKYIYSANQIIEGATMSNKLSDGVKNSVLGQAYFIRAFCFFYLVNLFGDIPLTLSSDYRINSTLPRSPRSQVYSQIIDDLKISKGLLPETYLTTDRVKPNKWTAAALLARTYLYLKDWQNAENEASGIINSNAYALESDLDNVFLKSSHEAIWQMKPVVPNYNTWEGNNILPATVTSSPTYLLTSNFVNSIEANDQRKLSWILSRSFNSQSLSLPYKYKVYGNGAPLTEYYMVFRLAEQYLIRAEARAWLNNINGSQTDLNIIRHRAGLGDTPANTQSSLLVAIAQEKRVELFAEWGHRWFDLIRTGTANSVLGNLKPMTWQPTDVLWPIPQSQINLNPYLKQNPGY